MKEEKLLNNTLKIIKEHGNDKAYEYLSSNIDKLDDKSSQVYNYLYCLAATSNRHEESLDWIKESIEIKGYWYRSEVFEDEDLDSIRKEDRFKKYLEISNERFLKAKEMTETVFTWKIKEKENIMVILHGNQQNNEINNALSKTHWKAYNDKVLSGFSSGSNTILRTLTETDTICDKVILISPWIPYTEKDAENIINKLIDKDIKVLIICGKEDQDCYPQCKLFESQSKEHGLKINSIYIDNLGHGYPDDFLDMVGDFLI